MLGSQDKEGRSGRMTFVTVGHEIVQDGAVVVREEQHIVYRARRRSVASGPASGPGVPQALGAGAGPVGAGVPTRPCRMGRGRRPDTFLFRYSALTYNAHRIHYDRDFARDVEGYPGLVVHGPLQATLMAEAARRRGWSAGPLQLAYRMQSPLFDHQGSWCQRPQTGDGFVTQVRDRWGRPTATGTVRAG